MTDNDVKTQRSKIRSGIFQKGKTESKRVDFFGQEVEIRQATMRSLLAKDLQDESQSKRAAIMIVQNTFIPDTNERVFEDTDVDQIEDLPFGPDMRRMQEAMNQLMGVDAEAVEEQVKNSEETPQE